MSQVFPAVTIDAHLHLGLLGFTPDGIIRYLDQHRLDKCWLMTWEEESPARASYVHCSADDVLAEHRRHPGRIVPMYAPDPRREDATAAVAGLRDRGFRGCAELKTTLDWQSPEMRDYLAAVAATGLPLLFHMEAASVRLEALESDGPLSRLLARAWNSERLGGFPARLARLLGRGPLAGWRRRRSTRLPAYLPGFASLELALRSFPGLAFIGHGPLFWRHVITGGATVRLMTDYPNLYIDTSAVSGFRGLSRNPAFARELLTRFKDRVLFGTDNRVLGQLGFLESLGLEPDALGLILGGNACRLVGE
ncbi:amidohydrolase family protein [candidate division WOR-3 bacterium]|nr:amidohydrolase family protein [candidate division WOR-3 bacterium]